MVGLLALALTLALVAAAPAAAHHGGVPAGDAAAGPGTKVSLRGCFLTAVFVPREAAALQPFFRRPVDLGMTFYGPDPLLGCGRSRATAPGWPASRRGGSPRRS